MPLVDQIIKQPNKSSIKPDRNRYTRARPQEPTRSVRTNYAIPRQITVDTYRRFDQPRYVVNPEPAMPAAPLIARKKFVYGPPPRPSRVKAALQYLAIMIWAITFGIGANTLLVGEIAIGIYALVAFTMRIRSRVSLLLSVLAFGAIFIVQAGAASSALSTNFVIYAFSLLVIGIISLIFETGQLSKWYGRQF